MRGYLIKIYPNKTQQKALDLNFGCCRFVYNKMIEINQKVYKRRGETISEYDMCYYLTKIKKQHTFLREADSQALMMACNHLANAYRNFFQKKRGCPKFKKKNGKQSFSSRGICRILENQIKLPKLKPIKFRGGDGRPEGKIK